MSNLSGFVKRLRDIMRNDAGINGDAQRIEQIAWMLFLKVYDAKEQDWKWDDDEYVSIIPEECRWQNWAVDDHTGTALTGDKLLDFVNNTLFPVLKGTDIKDSNGKVIISGVKVDSSTPIKKAIVQTTFADANQYMKDGVLLRQVINVIDDLDLGDYEESHAFGEIYETILKELQSAGSSGEFYTPRAVTDFMAKMINPQIGEQVADFACGTGGFLTSWLKELAAKIETTEDQSAYDASIYGIEKKQFPYMLCITNMLLHGIDVPKIYHDNSLLKDVLDYTQDDQFDVILMNPPYGGNEKTEVKNHFPADLASSETADLFMSVIMYRLKKNGRAAVILPDGFLFGTDNAKVAIKKKLFSEFNLHTVIRMPHSVFAPYTSITTNILFFDHTKSTEETWFYRLDMPEGYKNFSKTKPMELKHFTPAMDWWDNREKINIDGFDKAKKFTVEEIAARNYNIDLCGYPHEEEEVLAPADLIQKYEEKRASLNAEIDRTILALSASLNGEPVNFDTQGTISACGKMDDLHKRFPEDMKKSILQYAIQGKLVEQRLEEGTGAELYKQMQAEKQRLIKEGKIKKEKPLPEIAEDEIPFDIPESWRWVRFSEIMSTMSTGPFGSMLHKTDYIEKGIPLVNPANMVNGKIVPSDKMMISEATRRRLSSYILHAGMIVLGRRGEMGRCAVVTEKEDGWLCGTGSFFMEPSMSLYVYYVVSLFSSPYVKFYLGGESVGTTMSNLNHTILSKMPIPLPPLAEQRRIVAKLDEILPLCERLK